MRKKRAPRLLIALLACAAPAAPAQIAPAEVALLVNDAVPESAEAARIYRRLRNVPAENVLRLSLGRKRRIPRSFYEEKLAAPVERWLRARPGITTLLSMTGVPYLVEAVEGKPESDAAVDSELAAVLFEKPPDPARWAANPLFVKGGNLAASRQPRALGLVFTARLDGPSLEIIERQVKDAIHVEEHGLSGGVFADTRGFKSVTGYGLGDALLREGLDRLAGAGFPAVLDEDEASWLAGPEGRSSIAAGAAYYSGWYRLRSFEDIFGEEGLARGAIAWHLASGEAVDIWSPAEKGWAVNLLRRGAAATWGPVREPYVHAFPHADVLLDSLLAGRALAEAFWLSLPHVSWAMVLLGDPLYRPFAQARPSLACGAYRAAGEGPPAVIAGRRAPILARVRSIGPPGSGTPPLEGRLQAGSGTSHAAGTVKVRALPAGESELVLLPEVEVRGGPGDPFRVILDLEAEDGSRRQVVLEGRVGLARLTAEGWNQQIMVAEERAGALALAGMRSAPALLEVETLAFRPLALGDGRFCAGAEFSPDAARIALRLAASLSSPGGSLLREAGETLVCEVGDFREAPSAAGVHRPESFIHWLSPKEALFTAKSPGGGEMLRIDLQSGRSSRLADLPRWRAQPAGGGAEIFLLLGPGGEVAFRRGAEAPVEVLRGKGPFTQVAMAADLSAFWGIDRLRRLWCQHGAAAEPEVVAEDAGGKVVWSAAARRVAFSDMQGKGRIYDSGTRTTIDIGPFVEASWSGKEECLATIDHRGEKGRLRLWTPGGPAGSVPLDRLGALAAIGFADSGRRIFLLAAAGVEFDVWVLSLGP
jgi:uncharacterized protein (TIGR03790 family)